MAESRNDDKMRTQLDATYRFHRKQVMKRLKKTEITLETVTPLFLGGAEVHNAEK